MITITVNGAGQTVQEGMSLDELLDSLGARVETILIEQNGELIKREGFAHAKVGQGDVIELIRVTGGG